MHKFYDGKIESDTAKIVLTDNHLAAELGRFHDEFEVSLESYKFRQALQAVVDIARLGNRYLTEKRALEDYKNKPGRCKKHFA